MEDGYSLVHLASDVFESGDCRLMALCEFGMT